ncbi:hypothetical protein MTO96_041831 [Rhipicephalus appendiculatus]
MMAGPRVGDPWTETSSSRTDTCRPRHRELERPLDRDLDPAVLRELPLERDRPLDRDLDPSLVRERPLECERPLEQERLQWQRPLRSCEDGRRAMSPPSLLPEASAAFSHLLILMT